MSHNTHKPDRLFPQIKQRSHPSSPIKPDRLNLNIKQRSPLSTHKTRSPISPHQTAIALLIYIDDYVRINAKQVVEP
ncbi:hypothetical protein H6F42_18800 [Pseudanabaena sp. FACHB-1998]|uniref:hypothetical protein n=1 Tax=Pseudanabaena sp. FACHB-1998 TaxID=2692858 RepID=UPI001681AD91|nr:hypothetical protein [Pseudanabaena sp. FACHB-1998]MBD2178975.1 hypothetical protein [Pseudanabaena sp. FACHB-1998]